MPTTKQWVLGVIGILAVWSVITHFWLGPYIFEKQRQSGKDIADSTYDAENAIQEYEWFRQQYYDIEAKRQQINNTKQEESQFHETYGDDPENWSRSAEKRHNRIHTRLTSQRNLHDQYIADYNARSEMANRVLFKCGLPYEMEQKFWLGDGRPDDKYLDGMKEEPPKTAEECNLPEKIEANQSS